jgi:hypothetical protein
MESSSTDREVTENTPDIIVKNKKEKTCTLEAEKKLKYKCLRIETQRMWNLKCTIIPAIIGANGKIWKLYQENIRYIHYKRQQYLEHHR